MLTSEATSAVSHLIVPKAVGMRLGLPEGGRRPTAELIPPECEPLARSLYDLLPTARLKAEDIGRKEALARALAASIVKIDGYVADACRFFEAIVRSTVVIRGTPDDRQESYLRESKLRELLPLAPRVYRPKIRQVTLEVLATATAAEIHSHDQAELWAAVRYIVRSLFEGFDALVLATQIGVIDWLGEGICRYRFFRSVVIQEYGRERVNRTAERETRRQDIVETHRLAEHLHELINARSDSLPAEQVRKPAAVETLLEATPTWLAPYLRVVSGDQIRELIVETDLRVNKRVKESEKILYRPDPALTLGRYVLAGWTDEDLPPLGRLASVLRWITG